MTGGRARGTLGAMAESIMSAAALILGCGLDAAARALAVLVAVALLALATLLIAVAVLACAVWELMS